MAARPPRSTREVNHTIHHYDALNRRVTTTRDMDDLGPSRPLLQSVRGDRLDANKGSVTGSDLDNGDNQPHWPCQPVFMPKSAGKEAFDDLIAFVSERNTAAALALGARRDVLLAFRRLEGPSTLNTTFPSTNLIEIALPNWREATGNVKRRNEKQHMATALSLSAASTVLRAEKGIALTSDSAPGTNELLEASILHERQSR